MVSAVSEITQFKVSRAVVLYVYSVGRGCGVVGRAVTFRHQKSAVQIQSSAKFILPSTVFKNVSKRGNERKKRPVMARFYKSMTLAAFVGP